ncbi:MAG: S9 family peptidase [Tepidiformaceae bacterium]
MPSPLSPSTLVYGFTVAGEPQVSPDGRAVLYTLSSTDRETKKTSSQLWLCGIDGSQPRQLTFGGQRNSGGRWSPDGRQIAFTSDRVEKAGLFVMPMAGGEPRELTRYHAALNDLAWSPDGTRIAFTAAYDPANPAGDKPPDGAAPKVRVTSRIDYKQDVRGYLADVRSQLFVVDVASGERHMVTCEPIDHTTPEWSPDGTRLLCKVATENGMVTRLAIVPAAGEGSPLFFTHPTGVASTYSWSPDGGRIVYTGDTWQSSQTDFFVYDVAKGDTRRVTDDLQCLPDADFAPIVPPSQPAWLDDQRVLFHAVRAGSAGLYVIDLESGAVEQVEGERELRVGMSVDAEQRHVVQAVASLDSFGEISVFDRRNGGRKVVTQYSAPTFAESPPAAWERFDITRGGHTTEAWMLKPPAFDPARKYPVVLDIHGGPNGFYGYGFNAIQQCLATNGFIVVFSNPRGSSSYGRDFTQQVTKDWGGEDYLDLMAVIDRALEEPYCDPARTGIWGYSYGGYMTARTIARNHRFKAAVCGAPCFDLESMYGTSDISHFFGPMQWGGTPWEDREWYATHSPSQFAHNTRTPTLIIQGEADERCPVGQGEQMFVTLKKAGCEVEFARYPGQSHLFVRIGPPEHREDVLERMLAWFKRHLGEPA